MSKGPGAVERRIADLFAVTRDRALSVSVITDHAFELGGRPPTRVQRLSATRAAHRLLRRMRDDDARCQELYASARRNTESALGYPWPADRGADPEHYDAWHARWKSDPACLRAERLSGWCKRFGTWVMWETVARGRYMGHDEFWRATIGLDRALYFHPPDVPVRVWAVSVQPAGVIWADAEVTRITERNVIVSYAGEVARLDRRKLWSWWAFWRGVRFVSSRTGRIAAAFDELWQDRYGRAAGGVPPAMQMPLAEAMALLGVPGDYTYDDVIAAFRLAAKKAHPDVGGTAEMFRKLVDARDRLLAALGTNAPAPKMPTYAPAGAKVVYRPVKLGSGRRRLGSTRRLASA